MLEIIWSRAVLRALEVQARVAIGKYAVGSSLDVALAVTAIMQSSTRISKMCRTKMSNRHVIVDCSSCSPQSG